MWNDPVRGCFTEGGWNGRTVQRRGLPGRPPRGTARRPGEASGDDQGRRPRGDRIDQLPDAGVQGPWSIARVLRRVQEPLQPLPHDHEGHRGTQGRAGALPVSYTHLTLPTI